MSNFDFPVSQEKLNFSDDFNVRKLVKRLVEIGLSIPRKQTLYLALVVNCLRTVRVGPNLLIRAIMMGDTWLLC